MAEKDHASIAVILGAGASRGVSYRHQNFASPLDTDFFDLLQRLPGARHDDIQYILRQASNHSEYVWESLEKCFYTLENRAHTRTRFFNSTEDSRERIHSSFVNSIHSLLGAAHAGKHCDHHQHLFDIMGSEDIIINFNYDLVIEHALDRSTKRRGHLIGPWLYGFPDPHDPKLDIPAMYKLHGSLNWRTSENHFEAAMGPTSYQGKGGALLLPFWDKKIEEPPWSNIWEQAAAQLKNIDVAVVWGYSLPVTDLKSRELFRAALEHRNVCLCVIDPSRDTRQRWRALLPDARFWIYSSMEDFRISPPMWWKEADTRRIHYAWRHLIYY